MTKLFSWFFYSSNEKWKDSAKCKEIKSYIILTFFKKHFYLHWKVGHFCIVHSPDYLKFRSVWIFYQLYRVWFPVPKSKAFILICLFLTVWDNNVMTGCCLLLVLLLLLGLLLLPLLLEDDESWLKRGVSFSQTRRLLCYCRSLPHATWTLAPNRAFPKDLYWRSRSTHHAGGDLHILQSQPCGSPSAQLSCPS